jgi:hypothetical protein
MPFFFFLPASSPHNPLLILYFVHPSHSTRRRTRKCPMLSRLRRPERERWENIKREDDPSRNNHHKFKDFQAFSQHILSYNCVHPDSLFSLLKIAKLNSGNEWRPQKGANSGRRMENLSKVYLLSPLDSACQMPSENIVVGRPEAYARANE